jgi:hypothetical protein
VKITALIVLAVACWAVGTAIGAAPRFMAAAFWLAGGFCLGYATYLHIRNQG